MNYLSHYSSALGPMTLASDGEALTGLWFDGQKYFAAGLRQTIENEKLPVFARTIENEKLPVFARTIENEKLPVFMQTTEWLQTYFGGEVPDFTPPLLMQGTEFQRQVWKLLLTIPYGRTVTYKELAGRIAAERGLSHMSAQAVGQAVGHNPISIIVPCHRVLGTDGSLTGYAGGIDRKRQLLSLEGISFADVRESLL